MELIQFVPVSSHFDQQDSFLRYVQKQLSFLREDSFEYTLQAEGMIWRLICHTWPKHLSMIEVAHTFRHFFSAAVAEYLIDELESQLIKQLIKEKYAFQEEEQLKAIYHYCYQWLCLDEHTFEVDKRKLVKRKSNVFKKAYDFLQEEKLFHLLGFIQFRLKEYQEELHKVIQHAIDEFILDQEYDRFIQLLRYFVSIQKPKISFIHVLHIEGKNFVLYDVEGKVVTDQEISEFIQEWAVQEVSYEDVVVSTLISIAPKRLMLHTQQASESVIHTLKNIFAEQVILCQGCAQCDAWRKQRNGQESQSPLRYR